MPDYAIIIPAYNEEALLAQTIASVREAMAGIGGEFGSGELIIVNNNSTDRTGEVAVAAGADQVVLEPHNQIARARNAGAEATTAECLVFIDADTRVPSETLRQALDLLASGTIAAGGARIVMDQSVSPMVDWLVRTWNGIAANFDYAAGSFFFARRDAFEAGGGFDELVYAGEEASSSVTSRSSFLYPGRHGAADSARCGIDAPLSRENQPSRPIPQTRPSPVRDLTGSTSPLRRKFRVPED